MKKIIVIIGPTGVGKTKLSIELAKCYNGEIINADAMQIYQGLDIGTAKIKENEKEGIPHHLFDIKKVTEEYSIYQYQKDCRNIISEVQSRNKTPIIVGGTGLYIKSALYDYKLEPQKKDINLYETLSTEELYQKLINLDKDAVGKIDANNRRRIINALNYYENNQCSITKNKTETLLYDAVFIGLTTERNHLYQIIDNRVDKMLKDGLLKEVEAFYRKKIYTKPLLGGIGYKELYEYFDNLSSLKEAVQNIKRNSRRYAKRQYTFFRNQLPVVWFQTNYSCFNRTVKVICKYLDSID